MAKEELSQKVKLSIHHQGPFLPPYGHGTNGLHRGAAEGALAPGSLPQEEILT